ncbi:hypothetical protein ACFXAZ_36775 [Streptomyces sp. NPDC059477]|uniref:hypothetical protein n=1 Tax=Streptomyces sp. NPDC059477 TaxID=3346847 RepID=UPI0036A466B8
MTRLDADGGRLGSTPQGAIRFIDIPLRRQASAPPATARETLLIVIESQSVPVRVRGFYGAAVSIEMPPAGGDAGPGAELPGAGLTEADEVLAGALAAHGDAGVRALGLLRDARRALTGAAGLERPQEVAAACVRSAADALLDLPGAPRSVGLRSAAEDLLAAVDAAGARRVPPQRPVRRGRPPPSPPGRRSRPPTLPPPAAAPVIRGARRVRRAGRGSGWRERPGYCAASWSARAATTGAGHAGSSSG